MALTMAWYRTERYHRGLIGGRQSITLRAENQGRSSLCRCSQSRDFLFLCRLRPARIIGFQQVPGIGRGDMMADAVRVIQALVLNDSRSGLLYTV
jgi:hypothetical protein